MKNGLHMECFWFYSYRNWHKKRDLIWRFKRIGHSWYLMGCLKLLFLIKIFVQKVLSLHVVKFMVFLFFCYCFLISISLYHLICIALLFSEKPMGRACEFVLHAAYSFEEIPSKFAVVEAGMKNTLEIWKTCLCRNYLIWEIQAP